MAGTGRRERRNKQLHIAITQSLHDKLAKEAERSTNGNIAGLSYMLLQLGLRHWTACDDISTGEDRARPTINLSRLDK
jgi:hypothetical protein